MKDVFELLDVESLLRGKQKKKKSTLHENQFKLKKGCDLNIKVCALLKLNPQTRRHMVKTLRYQQTVLLYAESLLTGVELHISRFPDANSQVLRTKQFKFIIQK